MKIDDCACKVLHSACKEKRCGEIVLNLNVIPEDSRQATERCCYTLRPAEGEITAGDIIHDTDVENPESKAAHCTYLWTPAPALSMMTAGSMQLYCLYDRNKQLMDFAIGTIAIDSILGAQVSMEHRARSAGRP